MCFLRCLHETTHTPAQDHAEDDDDDDDEEEEEEEESKAAAARGSRRHAMGSQNEPTDQPLVRSMATGSTFSALQDDSRGPVVGQLIVV
jgi:septal ring factor EnvC (AmiA/AmiB activator)